MTAGKFLDFYSCLPGHYGEQADAEQAYLQADFTGVETWIRLPEEAWLPEWKGMTCPVVRLEKALYGHPDSGTAWEKHCDQILRDKLEFVPVPNWDSVYYHKNGNYYSAST